MEEKFDVVNLIEKNPITRLSKDYQNRLIKKVQNMFTDHQQQLFISSFFCFLRYNPKNDFVVNFDEIWKWMGFTRKDHAKRLLDKILVENIDYKIFFPPKGENSENANSNNKNIVFLQSQENSKKEINIKDKKINRDKDGNIIKNNSDEKNKRGRPEEKILMTINAFKKFCLKANTARSDEIHDYYIKMEELLQETINEETDELREQLLLKDTEHKTDIKKEKHNTLVNLHKKKNCVYLCEIDANNLIKIGSSKEVDDRNKSLSSEYKNKLVFLDIFECDHFREAEDNILRDPVIIDNLYKQPIKPNGKTSCEVVKLTEDFTYSKLVSIVKHHVNNVQNSLLSAGQLLDKQRMEIEKQKIELENKKIDSELLLAMIKNNNSGKIKKFIENKFENMLNNVLLNMDKDKIKDEIEEQIKEDTTEIIKEEVKNEVKKIADENIKENIKENININPDNKIVIDVNRNIRKPQGRKIQKIEPNDLTKVVKVYDSMMYLLRSPENDRFKKPCMEKAINSNLIYQGYRWCFVEDGCDPNISVAKPTKESKCQNSDVILQLNESKTKILNSFSTKKELSKELKITKKRLNKMMQEDIKFNNCFYVTYSECPDELLKKFNGSTTRKVNASNSLGPIKRIDPITKSEIIFNTFDEINVKLGYRRVTIKKAIDNKTLYGGHIWEYCK
jgi:hypothetical protein